ncbi:hypothetical protein BKA70DRAFT_1219427 [Coprinopsis sp. MPI-PUGE-AT-0042]|nr:hypothetical protein BKA70DRAFT_1219427 [Coprinopsis sp. MPI-PUGE-AT-0042]
MYGASYFLDHPHMYSNVVTIMVESTAPLAVFDICFLIAVAIAKLHPHKSLIARGKVTVIADMFNWLYYNTFCALSPQIVIFLVTAGRSWRNMEESHVGGMSFSTPIEFAPTATATRSSDSTDSI